MHYTLPRHGFVEGTAPSTSRPETTTTAAAAEPATNALRVMTQSMVYSRCGCQNLPKALGERLGLRYVDAHHARQSGSSLRKRNAELSTHGNDTFGPTLSSPLSPTFRSTFIPTP